MPGGTVTSDLLLGKEFFQTEHGGLLDGESLEGHETASRRSAGDDCDWSETIKVWNFSLSMPIAFAKSRRAAGTEVRIGWTRSADQDVSTASLPEILVFQPERLSAVLLLGMPGVGKGTQGTLLGTTNRLFHVSTGAILRSLDANSEEGRAVRARIDHGEYIPDDLALRIWRSWLEQRMADGRYDPRHQTLILDGIPRTVEQCAMLNDRLDVRCVIHLASATEEPIIERLRARAIEEGRPDDASEAIIRKRFAIYRAATEPVLRFYAPEIIHTINPLGTPMEVKRRILERVLPSLRVSLWRS